MILNAIFMPTMCIIDKFNGLLLFEFKTEKAFYYYYFLDTEKGILLFLHFFYNYFIVLPSLTSTLFYLVIPCPIY